MRLNLSLVLLSLALMLQAEPPAGYYSDAEGESGKELKNVLYQIIKSGYKQLSYDDLYAVYESSDVTEDGKIWDMYSTCTWTPGQKKCGNYKNVCDCYNREHSIPKSWFNDKYPMYSDAFHLYPTDGKVNGQRSNYPFGECSGGTTLNKGKGRLGNSTYPGYSGKVFEPADEYKGDFARTYFYFATRYENIMTTINGPSFNNTVYPAFTTWSLQMFLEWHRNDPVSEKEVTRNDEIYRYQKNRNPFIDNPELVEYIWGNKVDAPWVVSGDNSPEGLMARLVVDPKEKTFMIHNIEGGSVDFRILNLSGQCLKTGVLPNGEKSSLSFLGQGMFFIQISSGKIKTVQKVIL